MTFRPSDRSKQRLALANGILAARESKLVLLVEPTVSVDPRTEALIYDNLFEALKDKAIIFHFTGFTCFQNLIRFKVQRMGSFS